MNNIADIYIGDKIKLIDTDGDSFVGDVVSILFDDETDGEPEIAVETTDGMIGFTQSDILSIEKL